MRPEIIAAVIVTATLCAVAGYVLLRRQGLRHRDENAELWRDLAWTSNRAASLERALERAEMQRQRAEVLMRRLCGVYPDPEETDLLTEELDAFDAIAREES